MPTKAQISELLNGAADFLDGRKLSSLAWLRTENDTAVDIIRLRHSANLHADLAVVAKACVLGSIKVRLLLAPPAPQSDCAYRREFEDAATETMMSHPIPEVQEKAAYYSKKFPPNHGRQAMLWTSDKIADQYGEAEAGRIMVKWMRHAANA